MERPLHPHQSIASGSDPGSRRGHAAEEVRGWFEPLPPHRGGQAAQALFMAVREQIQKSAEPVGPVLAPPPHELIRHLFESEREISP